jgi:hypothetical protein
MLAIPEDAANDPSTNAGETVEQLRGMARPERVMAGLKLAKANGTTVGFA